ncbi:MAG: hypothetical protein WCP11_03440 [Candidatus Saccharibacteria bacterium]
MEENTNQEPETANIKPQKAKRKHKLLKFIVGLVIVITAILLTANFALPGLITAKDLGVKYSSSDYDSAAAKLSTIKELLTNLSNISGYSYGVPKNIDVSLNSSEITAFINTNNMVKYAANNYQVLVNPDGTIETSGAVNVDFFLREILNNKISREQIVKGIPALALLPSSVNLYMKFSGEVIANKSSAAIKDVAVQGITIPTKYVNTTEAVSTFTSGIDSFLAKNNPISGTSIDSLTTKDGLVNLKAKIPSMVNTR